MIFKTIANLLTWTILFSVIFVPAPGGWPAEYFLIYAILGDNSKADYMNAGLQQL